MTDFTNSSLFVGYSMVKYSSPHSVQSKLTSCKASFHTANDLLRAWYGITKFTNAHV